LPHCRVGSALAGETPIWVDHVDDHPGPAAVLINLQGGAASFFSRFERLAEIVGTDQTDAAAVGRASASTASAVTSCARIVSPSVDRA